MSTPDPPRHSGPAEGMPAPNSAVTSGVDPSGTAAGAARPSVLSYVLGGLGLAALLAMAMFFFAAGLLAPLWAVIVLCTIWTALVVIGCLTIRKHPLRVLLLPVIAAAVWFGGINAGAAFLGWTA